MPKVHTDNIELYIIDELCHCGHLQSDHNDTVQFGHGVCTKCDCPKFTFVSYVVVTDSEARDLYKKRGQDHATQQTELLEAP